MSDAGDIVRAGEQQRASFLETDAFLELQSAVRY
jgi:hypothetical protein